MVYQSFARSSLRQIQNASELNGYGESRLAQSLIRCAQESEKEIPTYRCQSRYCSFCSWRSANRLCKLYVPRFTRIVQQGNNLGSFTVTIPNLSAMTATDYKRLAVSFKTFLHQQPMKDCFVGVLAKTETDYNAATEEYQPHIHSLVVYRRGISQPVLKAAWGQLTCTEEEYMLLRDRPDTDAPSRSVWIKKLADHRHSSRQIEDAVIDAISYMCKAPAITSPQAFAQYILATRGKHLVRAFGNIRKNAS